MEQISTNKLESLLKKYLERDRGKPVSLPGRYSGTDTSYQKITTWRVGDLWGLRRGQIKEVSLWSNNYAKTRFRLTVMKKALFKDLQIDVALTLPFPLHEIPFGEEIVLECKSIDDTNITTNGSIMGREF